MKNYQNTVFNKDILEVKECFLLCLKPLKYHY